MNSRDTGFWKTKTEEEHREYIKAFWSTNRTIKEKLLIRKITIESDNFYDDLWEDHDS